MLQAELAGLAPEELSAYRLAQEWFRLQAGVAGVARKGSCPWPKELRKRPTWGSFVAAARRLTALGCAGWEAAFMQVQYEQRPRAREVGLFPRELASDASFGVFERWRSWSAQRQAGDSARGFKLPPLQIEHERLELDHYRVRMVVQAGKSWAGALAVSTVEVSTAYLAVVLLAWPPAGGPVLREVTPDDPAYVRAWSLLPGLAPERRALLLRHAATIRGDVEASGYAVA